MGSASSYINLVIIYPHLCTLEAFKADWSFLSSFSSKQLYRTECKAMQHDYNGHKSIYLTVWSREWREINSAASWGWRVFTALQCSLPMFSTFPSLISISVRIYCSHRPEEQVRRIAVQQSIATAVCWSHTVVQHGWATYGIIWQGYGRVWYSIAYVLEYESDA